MKCTSFGTFYSSFLLNSISNGDPWHNKPEGGYWASPRTTDSWEHWCMEQDLTPDLLNIKTTFDLDLKDRVLVIDSFDIYDQLTEKYPYPSEGAWRMPDWTLFFDAVRLGIIKQSGSAENLIQRLKTEGYSALFSASSGHPNLKPLDFEKVLQDYKAIVVYPNRRRDIRLQWPFHSWDCDTVVVSDPTVMHNVEYFIKNQKINSSLAYDLASAMSEVKREYILEERQPDVKSLRFKRAVDLIISTLNR